MAEHGSTVAIAAAVLAASVGLLLSASRPAGPKAPALPDGPRALTIAEWLAGHSNDWRVARMQQNPAVLAIEFPDLATQGAAMNRIAALLEKAGAPRDRVLGEVELAALIAGGGDNAQTFYQGHDYDGAGLARFYALASRQGVPLNRHEERLRRELILGGVLDETPHGLQPRGMQALITFTATQVDDPSTTADETVDERRRESVLRHETSHGTYYTRPAYREHSRRFWRDVLTPPQRAAMRRYLAGLGYDSSDEDLMLNEAQAFLMHTPDARAFDAQSIGIGESELAALREAFWRTLPAEAAEPAARAAPAEPASAPARAAAGR